MRKKIAWLCLGLFVLVLDMASKFAVYRFMICKGSDSIVLLDDFFGIRLLITPVVNLGAAWGILAEHSLGLLLFRLCLIVGLAFYIFFSKKRLSHPKALSLILFGALSNVLDFFIYGYVIDMVHCVFWGYHYPVFNVADSAICLGVAWIAFSTLFGTKKRLQSDACFR